MTFRTRVLITLAILATPFILGLLITYEVIQLNWISLMEIQPSFRPMEDPLPLPERSVPVQGAVSIQGLGSPDNPVPADDVSLQRGEILYQLHCALCHGESGEGDGPIAGFLDWQPADLSTPGLVMSNDGAIFLTITNGIPDRMPALRENLLVRERWDVVNFVRNLQQ